MRFWKQHQSESRKQIWKDARRKPTESILVFHWNSQAVYYFFLKCDKNIWTQFLTSKNQHRLRRLIAAAWTCMDRVSFGPFAEQGPRHLSSCLRTQQRPSLLSTPNISQCKWQLLLALVGMGETTVENMMNLSSTSRKEIFQIDTFLFSLWAQELRKSGPV